MAISCISDPLRRIIRPAKWVWLVLLIAMAGQAPLGQAARLDGMPEGSGTYDDFVALFQEFLAWQDPERASGDRPNRDIAGAAAEVHPDYGAQAVAERLAQMEDFQSRPCGHGRGGLAAAATVRIPGRSLPLRSARIHAEGLPSLVSRSRILC